MASNTDFLLSIRTSVKLHETLLKKICETCHLTLIEGKVIASLHNNPGKDTAADIAEFRMLSKGNVSQAVESLIQKGLLQRIPDLHDRRRIHLVLLASSDPITAKIDCMMEEYRQYLFQGFSQKELDCYQKLSERIMENTKNAMKGRNTYE